MAARSLGLTYAQSMRYVVLPQAIRRVIPPLLNDFIGLQKDTAIISVIGVGEAALARSSTRPTPTTSPATRSRRSSSSSSPSRSPASPTTSCRSANGANGRRPARWRRSTSSRSRTSRSASARTSCCATSISGSTSIRWSASSAPPARASRRCFAASTCSSGRRGAHRRRRPRAHGGQGRRQRLRRKIGMVFQEYNLFPHMTALQNVTLAPRRRSAEAAEANSAPASC